MAGGGAYRDEDADGAITDINVTPLVDITLVLLIIFMVTAKLIVSRGIDVESPRTVAGGEVKGPLEVTIQPGPRWFLNGQPATLGAIDASVRQRLVLDAELRPIITADRRVPHGDVMTVVDMIKVAGVKRFAMTTEVKAEP
jgi:biopolymer transport protein ExbD